MTAKRNGKRLILSLVVAAAITLAACDRHEQDWQQAKAADTVDAINTFLEKHPDTSFSEQARARLDELEAIRDDFIRASNEDTVEAYERIASTYPRSEFARKAEEQIAVLREADAWQRARQRDDPQSYQDFLRAHANSAFGSEAESRLSYAQERESAWQVVQERDDLDALLAFVETWRDGPEPEEAWKLIAGIHETRARRLNDLVPRARAGAQAAIKKLDAFRSESSETVRLFIWEFRETKSDGSNYRSKIVVGSGGAAALQDEVPYYRYPRAFRGGADIEYLFGNGSQLIVEGGPIELPPASRGAPAVTVRGDPTLFLGVQSDRGLVHLGGKGSIAVEGRVWRIDSMPTSAALLAALRSPMQDDRIGAAWSLGRLPLDDEAKDEAAPLLIRMLESSSLGEQTAGAEALARLAPTAALRELERIFGTLELRGQYRPALQFKELVQFAYQQVAEASELQGGRPWPPPGYHEDGTLLDASIVSRILIPAGRLSEERLNKGSITIEEIDGRWNLMTERPNDSIPISFAGGIQALSGIPAGIGSEVRFKNRARFGAVTLAPLTGERLSLKRTIHGWVYLSGGGTVTPESTGVPFDLGRHRTVDTCLELLASDDLLLVEGSIRDLGRIEIPMVRREEVMERIRARSQDDDGVIRLAVEEALKRIAEGE